MYYHLTLHIVNILHGVNLQYDYMGYYKFKIL
jgi:hypothetical protein